MYTRGGQTFFREGQVWRFSFWYGPHNCMCSRKKLCHFSLLWSFLCLCLYPTTANLISKKMEKIIELIKKNTLKYFLWLEKVVKQKNALRCSQIRANARTKCLFAILITSGMKNRLIRYLWILKMNLKYVPFPRFRELTMNFAHF